MGRDVDEIRKNPAHLLLLLRDCGLVHTGSTAWRAKCPVHQGDRLSLALNRNRDGDYLWNCFACGESGDALRLVMLLDGVGFKDALRTLAGGQHRERVYLWSKAQPKARKKGRERTRVLLIVPCEQWGCDTRLETTADDLLCLAESHPSWDFDIHGIGQIWGWCPAHHRSARTGRPVATSTDRVHEERSPSPADAHHFPAPRPLPLPQQSGSGSGGRAVAAPQTCVAPDLSTVAQSDASINSNGDWGI